jgi:pyruvyl transferase EpsO
MRITAWAWGRVGSAPAVVTERLHGHILCVLTGTPHVVIPDARGKIADFIETWGTLSDRAHLVEDPDLALELARDLAARAQQDSR